MERPILTLAGLDYEVRHKYAVYVPTLGAWAKPKPAAVIINLPGALLVRLFDLGMYHYSKEYHKRMQKND